MPTQVPCPHCGRPVEWSAASPFRPFCSKRCKLIDLGDWLAENHRIPGTDAPMDDEGSPQQEDRLIH
ncbi:DNA gyrase inhibitor YacG [uncultured Thiodictyon sp.]|uniref:DNA gyrase inhibitor YacG n=1 Tax=uncultured Thiodictyon sp. TaxID=1846217 RepID=UPI0025D2C305|nr:DNA gyrase inhibitor YacG [uncultured Thiodictyon sp.]